MKKTKGGGLLMKHRVLITIRKQSRSQNLVVIGHLRSGYGEGCPLLIGKRPGEVAVSPPQKVLDFLCENDMFAFLALFSN